jgi:hypothetical protein
VIQGSQAHAVVVNGDFLYAVNSGSDSFSTFRIGSDGRPVWLATTPSNGVRPVSIAIHGRLLFVLNQGIPTDDGGPINAFVKGFVLGSDGLASPIPDATFEFDSEDMPSDVFFTGNGEVLAVLKSGANAISTLRVASDGELSDNESILVGSQPVGGAATSRLPWTGFAAVVEDPGDASVVSFFAKETPLRIVSQILAPADIDPCWAVTGVSGERLWTSNFKPRSLSLYSVNAESELAFLSRWEPTPDTGPGSLDVDVSADGRFLYRLRAFNSDGSPTPPHPFPVVEVFRIESSTENGGLTLIQSVPIEINSLRFASPTGMAVASP